MADLQQKPNCGVKHTTIIKLIMTLAMTTIHDMCNVLQLPSKQIHAVLQYWNILLINCVWSFWMFLWLLPLCQRSSWITSRLARPYKDYHQCLVCGLKVPGRESGCRLCGGLLCSSSTAISNLACSHAFAFRLQPVQSRKRNEPLMFLETSQKGAEGRVITLGAHGWWLKLLTFSDRLKKKCHEQ